MTTTQLIKEVETITQNNLKFISKRVTRLSPGQKSWRPNEYTWNLIEIFSHLNEFSRFYHEAIQAKVARTRYTEPKENFMSSPLGKAGWGSMKLGNAKNVKRKFNAPKAYNPTIEKSILDENSIEQFQAYQTEWIAILEKVKTVNIRRVKIPISISKIVKFRLGDALLYVTYHNERHVQQAINLLAHPNFPKK